jgi:hypothetical protein
LGAGGPQTFELAERTLVGALGGVNSALKTNGSAIAAGEGVAEGRVLVEVESRIHLVFPKLGVSFGKAAELPITADEGVDVEAFFRGGGTEAFKIFGGEGLQLGAVFAADDVRLSVNAGFQGIHGRHGLARGGAWTG